MANPSPRWMSWRVAPAGPAAAPAPTPAALARRAAVLAPPAAEQVVGPDGVRWTLVARVRAEIAAGVYDTPEKWAEAEDRLFDRLAD